MSLVDTMMETCTMQDKKTVADGLGGFSSAWADGAKFQAAIVKDSTMETRIAEKSGFSESYTVTVAKGTPLEYADVFKRDSDGQKFRVTSRIKDSESPAVASFAYGYVTAERWDG